ncbi:unnamed protein product, partial [Ectocarpus sp. 4 AP-2014]
WQPGEQCLLCPSSASVHLAGLLRTNKRRCTEWARVAGLHHGGVRAVGSVVQYIRINEVLASTVVSINEQPTAESPKQPVKVHTITDKRKGGSHLSIPLRVLAHHLSSNPRTRLERHHALRH